MMNTKTMSAPTAKIVRLGDGASITVLMNGESLTLRASESQEAFDRALDALKTSNWDVLYSVMRPVKSFANKVPGVTVTSDKVLWNGDELHNAVASRILDFALAGLDHTPLCNFLAKLMSNPSKRAVEELYRFLEHKNLPITDNGNFLAYKGIGNDWYSLRGGTAKLIQGKDRDGKIYNGVGEVIEMARNAVDDNKDRTCSYGLHAGTEEYAKDYAGGGKLVIVEINPADVVSIPSDCNGQKLRTCKYKVVGPYTATLTKPLYKSDWKDEVDDIGEDEPVKVAQPRDANGRFASNKPSVPVVATPVVTTSKQPRDANGRFASNKTVAATPVAASKSTQTTVPTSTGDDEDYITFNTPTSDWIDNVEWFSDNGELIINKTDGAAIFHNNVPLSVVKDFEDYIDQGGSPGRFYNQHVKGSY
jgi:hypothetical protein